MTNEELHNLVQGTPYEYLLDMTDEQAAEILEKTYIYISGGRYCGKTLWKAGYTIAMNKAINKLRGEKGVN